MRFFRSDSFLSDKDSTLPVTYGFNMKITVPGGYHSGGAGYVLSGESWRRLTDALRAELAPLVPRIVGAATVMHDDDARLSLARQLLQAASDAA